jgi:hypothetical protein
MTEEQPTPPIVIGYADDALDWGIATLPKVILRFYRHLRCDGESLDDRQMMPLLLMLSLWEDREAPLRLSNLPSATSVATLEKRYLRKWRRMGLVFTRRVYYTHEEMMEVFGEGGVPATPRLKARLFDVSSLLHNCLRVACIWEQEAYPAVHEAWREEYGADRAAGKRVPQPPHPRYPSGQSAETFTAEIELPPELATELADKETCRYQFVPDKWYHRAKEIAQNAPEQIGSVRDAAAPDGSGTGTERVGTGRRTVTNRSGHPFNTSFQEVTPSAYAEGGPHAGPRSSSQQGVSASPIASEQGPPRRLPAGESDKGSVGPARVPSQGERDTSAPSSGLRIEPLPQRRRRVLADLRRFDGDRRTEIAIVTQNVGAILGLGLNEAGGLRTRPEKADYARIGALVKDYGGPQVVWKTACKAAAQPIDGDPLDYLQACLRNQRETRTRRGGGRMKGGPAEPRDGYPSTADGYGDDWEV